MNILKIREIDFKKDKNWIETLMNNEWGGCEVIVHEQVFHINKLSGFIAGENQGLLTYTLEPEPEIVTLNALKSNQGIGTALIEHFKNFLKEKKHSAMRVITTNDNLDALKFYQRKGFKITRIIPEAVNKSRKLKPSIPLIGNYGIPIRDEIELLHTL